MTKKTDETSGHFAQSGMEAPAKDAPKPTKKTEAKPDDAPAVTLQSGLSPKEQRAAINKQFEEADEKGKAAIIDETQAGLGVRGF